MIPVTGRGPPPPHQLASVGVLRALAEICWNLVKLRNNFAFLLISSSEWEPLFL